MASTHDRNRLKAGLILNVEVENALDGVIMVCLRHEGRAFRGILLDSDRGSCPVGLPNKDVLQKDLNEKFGVPKNDIATIEADVVRHDPHSALSYRQSYFQNMPLPPARPLLCSKPQSSPKQKLGPTYTTRTRPLKLRPRQNLCSNCKQECSKKKTAKRKLVVNGGDAPHHKKACLDPLNKATAKKSIKKAKVHSLKKTLKITYATPQGKDHLTISPRSAGISKKANALNQTLTQPTIVSIKSEKVKETAVEGNNFTSVKDKPKEKKKSTVNGFHPHRKKSKRRVNGKMANPKPVVPKQSLVPLKVPGEKENALSEVAAKEVLANGLKVHLVQDLFVPCSRGKAMDTSSESSYASSVSPKKRSRRQRKPSLKKLNSDNNSDIIKPSLKKLNGDNNSDIIKPELSDSEKEIQFKTQPENNNVLSNSSANKDQSKKVPPLNLKVHKKNVTKYRLADGRTMCLGDIVWGKILGFPWWPARISQIVVSRRDNGSVLKQEAQIRWLGATTVSHMPVETLWPFLPYFKERFNKKRRGVYKNAISQAMEEAKAVSPEVRALNTMFETSEIC